MWWFLRKLHEFSMLQLMRVHRHVMTSDFSCVFLHLHISFPYHTKTSFADRHVIATWERGLQIIIYFHFGDTSVKCQNLGEAAFIFRDRKGVDPSWRHPSSQSTAFDLLIPISSTHTCRLLQFHTCDEKLSISRRNNNLTLSTRDFRIFIRFSWIMHDARGFRALFFMLAIVQK